MEVIAYPECFRLFKAIDAMDKVRFVVYQINDTPLIVPKSVGVEPYSIYGHPHDEVECWYEFLEKLPENDCCYIAYNFIFKVESQFICKTAFILWIPDGASIEQKSLYSANVNFLMMYGERFDYKATDFSLLAYDLVVQDL